MTPYASAASLHHPGHYAAGWPDVGARRVRVAAERALNPWLLGLALIYLAWSYVHLSSSIWARFVLASYLIWRMRPDIIVPYCLSCMQLRLNMSGLDAGLEDVYASLTGFESYAFAIPPVLMAVRAVIALFNARVNRAAVPAISVALWVLGGFLVVAGAIYSKSNGYGWTASMRMYAIVGSGFYGMMMPRLDDSELRRLGGSMAFVGTVLSACSLYSIYGSQLLFLLGPLSAAWGVSGVLAREKPLLSLVTVAVSGSFCVFCSTLMQMLTWVWCAIAAVVEHTAVRDKGAPYKRIHAFVFVTFILCMSVFLAGFILYVEEKAEATGTLLGRIESKLYQDRGPLWVGFIRCIYDEPYFLPIPGRSFYIRSFGKDTLWKNGPHNMVLELLRQMGLIVGPICVAVLASLVMRLTRVMAYNGNRGGRAIGTAAISAIVVGGVTLPFILADRQGEVLLMAAGLVVTSCWRGSGARLQVS